jgi:programmed cell death protein 5
MPTEEELIKRRLLQQQAAQQMAAQQQVAQQASAQQAAQAQIKSALLQIMEPAARERLANLKLTKPQVAQQLELYLVQLYMSGQLRTRITEQQVIQILQKLTAGPEWKITRK